MKSKSKLSTKLAKNPQALDAELQFTTEFHTHGPSTTNYSTQTRSPSLRSHNLLLDSSIVDEYSWDFAIVSEAGNGGCHKSRAFLAKLRLPWRVSCS
ncbi:hypothetical protein AB1N83_011852 [Pleurotus pulmonarius]